jgi:hypothetical protein
VAGLQDLPALGTRLVFLNALVNPTYANIAGQRIVTGGTPAPNTIVNLSIGKALGDPIPLTINGQVNVDDTFEFCRLMWAAQAGVTAFFLIDDDRAGAGVQVNSPAAVLGGSVNLLGGAGNVALVTSAGGVIVDPTDRPQAFISTVSALNFMDFSPGVAGTNPLSTTASNVNGAILETAQLDCTAVLALLYVGTAAPANTADTTKPTIAGFGQSTTGTFILPAPVRIAAGLGIWYAVSGAGARIRATWRYL